MGATTIGTPTLRQRNPNPFPGEYVCFDGDKEIRRCVRELGQESLATNDNDLRGTRDGCSSPDNVLKVRPVHVDEGYA